MFGLVLAVLLSLCTVSPALAADDPRLPVPAALEPNVGFWTRIYTEVGTEGGLIHDTEHLGVVYETVTLPKNASRHARQRATDGRKRHYRDVLRRLAGGKRSNSPTPYSL